MAISPPVFQINPRLSKGFIPPSMGFARASAGYALGPAGLLVNSAAGAPRLAYDPANVGDPLGWLMEIGSANLALQSQGFSTGTWVKTRCGVGASTYSAPDGSPTATLLSDAASSSATTYFLEQDLTGLTSGVPYTFSVYARPGTRSQLALNPYIGANNTAVFDLAAGIVVSGPGAITSLGNGWFLCSVTCTSSATSGYFDISLAVSGTTSYASGAGGAGLTIWGAQIEQVSFPTSYIPTTNAVVPRATDTLAVPLTSIPGYNSTGGLWPAAGALTLRSVGSPLGYFAQYVILDDGTANNQIYIARNIAGQITVWVNDAAAVTVDYAFGTPAYETPFCCAISWANNTMAASFNGGGVVTGSGAFPAALTTLRLGQPCVPISHVALFGRQMAPADLQTLSSPL